MGGHPDGRGLGLEGGISPGGRREAGEIGGKNEKCEVRMPRQKKKKKIKRVEVENQRLNYVKR